VNNKTEDKLNAALFAVDDILVSPELAAIMLGIKKRYFNRLVAANSFNLQDYKYEHELFATVMYERAEIERVSHIYKSQKKAGRVK
jgi:hypothetical protein